MNNKPIFQLEELEDSVLYDLFYESGTILGGYLFKMEQQAEKNGDDARYQKLLKEEWQMMDDRDNIASDDRAGQIACKRRWDQRTQELRKEL